MKTRLLLIDDHAVVRAGFKLILESSGRYEVVGEAASGKEGIALYSKLKPDVTILDLSMAGASGLEVLERIRAKDSTARVMILSMHDDLAFASRAIKGGAFGFVSKTIEPEQLNEAVSKVAAGMRWIEPDIALKLALSKFGDATSLTDVLTSREFEVFCMLAKGDSVQVIAEKMHISEKTVGTHRTRLMDKLQLSNLAELARLAIRHNIIHP